MDAENHKWDRLCRMVFPYGGEKFPWYPWFLVKMAYLIGYGYLGFVLIQIAKASIRGTEIDSYEMHTIERGDIVYPIAKIIMLRCEVKHPTLALYIYSEKFSYNRFLYLIIMEYFWVFAIMVLSFFLLRYRLETDIFRSI